MSKNFEILCYLLKFQNYQEDIMLLHIKKHNYFQFYFH